METAVLEMTLEDLKKELSLVKQKVVNRELTGADMQQIALKVKRNYYTLSSYLNGNVPSMEIGMNILTVCNAFAAINAECATRKAAITC